MKTEKCGHCSGRGRIAIDHVAWIGDGKHKGQDIMGTCPHCDGSGDEPIVETYNFTKHESCEECGGEGYWFRKIELFDTCEYEKEQCTECERLVGEKEIA